MRTSDMVDRPTGWQEPYEQRPIHFREVRQLDDWRIKIYGIHLVGESLDWSVHEVGMATAWDELPRPGTAAGRLGLGFVIAHQGRGVHYLTLAWWDNENELCQRLFMRTMDLGDAWRPARAGEGLCVWDLQVVWFEREAYVDCVLRHPTAPDIAAYLARHMTLEA